MNQKLIYVKGNNENEKLDLRVLWKQGGWKESNNNLYIF